MNDALDNIAVNLQSIFSNSGLNISKKDAIKVAKAVLQSIILSAVKSKDQQEVWLLRQCKLKYDKGRERIILDYSMNNPDLFIDLSKLIKLSHTNMDKYLTEFNEFGG